MKDKIFQSLKQTFSSKYGVSDEVLQGYAESLATTGLINEDNLATVIQGQEAALKAFQRNFDRVRKEGRDYKKELEEFKAKFENPETKEKNDFSDITRLITETIAAGIKPLSEKIEAFEAKETQAKRNADISAKAKEYGIPESLVPMLSIPNDADLDSYMKDAKQRFSNAGFQGVQAPQSAEQQMEKNSHDIAALINKGTEEINKQN